MQTQQTPIPAEEMERARRAARAIVSQFTQSAAPWLDTDVLPGEAELALLYAAARFQPETGVPFTAWAGTLVRNRLLEEIRRQCPWKKQQREDRRASLLAGREPEGWMLPPLSLDQQISGHGEEYSLAEAIPGREEAPATAARLELAQLLAVLEPRRREIVVRYHLRGETTREIAAALGISTRQVQDLRQAAVAQLRDAAGVQASAPIRQPRDPRGPYQLHPHRQHGWPQGKPRAGCQQAQPVSTPWPRKGPRAR